MRLAHIIAVRQLPMAEIREVTCPEAESVNRVFTLMKNWETVFVNRVFEATRLPPERGNDACST